ncbi:hypothetical protein PC129_g14458 [Phytophthora cactorum]|uniref:Uncharacterized protein n=1 Tax=Phytophthora cactorum TaxID=29920 RepID=A0A8T1C2Q2_9STRA|nr:hypothetical protein Pcac1_g883 [Phytophthora cactorum]KAG2798984.1 hypothetical protein PC111_g20614 [Phytophthora cactorum]KAG2889861.1 hypothetical protein PC114_g17746 [Phytophthora cactorum]KAG2911365.1 hypothetical protein PC117_g19191 [Phytophthora cactorum]KAG3015525.1 hypothetical protein PC119_g11742 [Phytophthora cactorum]
MGGNITRRAPASSHFSIFRLPRKRSSQGKLPPPKMPRAPHPASAPARLVASYRADGDWMLVAAHNGIPPPSTARRIVDAGRVELLPEVPVASTLSAPRD